MKRHTIIRMAAGPLLLLLAAGLAHARELKPLHQHGQRELKVRDIDFIEEQGPPKSTMSVSFTALGMSYTELLPPPTDSETGFLPGVNLDAQYYVNPQLFLRAQFELDGGQTTYNGATQDGSTLLQTKTNDTILDGNLTAGYSTAIADQLRLMPYGGFGVHYWYRGITGSSGYPEKYLFFYLPLGAKLEWQPSPSITVALDAALHINLGGTIHADLSQFDPTEEDASGTLGWALGFHVELPVTYWMTPSFALRGGPFFEYFRIGEGNTFPIYSTTGQPPDYGQEPASNTYFYGAHLGVSFTF